jgi:hypothetical protein
VQNKLQQDPSGFVRASMSVPLFFQPYEIANIPKHVPSVQAAWKKTKYPISAIPTKVGNFPSASGRVHCDSFLVCCKDSHCSVAALSVVSTRCLTVIWAETVFSQHSGLQAYDLT